MRIPTVRPIVRRLDRAAEEYVRLVVEGEFVSTEALRAEDRVDGKHQIREPCRPQRLAAPVDRDGLRALYRQAQNLDRLRFRAYQPALLDADRAVVADLRRTDTARLGRREDLDHK